MDISGGQNFEGRKFKFETLKCFLGEKSEGVGSPNENMDPALL